MMRMLICRQSNGEKWLGARMGNTLLEVWLSGYKLETIDPRPETRDPRPETLVRRPETRDPRP
eukprot:1274763-Rhodomonas_salina.1